VVETYTLVEDLAGLIGELQTDSIVSRTFFKGDRMNAILFGFDAGQELSEHTSSKMAIIQIIQGEATVTLGDDKYELSSGAWIQMQPHLKHSVYAKTPMIMLLSMFDVG
jgi:quercetin dioxygenase-like cupin family protein